MKRSELVFNIVSIPVDIVSLVVAGLVSFYIRLRLEPLIPIVFNLDLAAYLSIIGKVIPILLIIFAYFGLYNLKGTRRFSKELYGIVAAISVSLLAIVVIFFFDQQVFPSRLILLVSWFTAIFFMAFGRLVLKRIQVAALQRGSGLHNLVVVCGKENESVVEYVRKNKELGFNVVAEIFSNENLIEKLQALYDAGKIEEVLQADPEITPAKNAELVQFTRNKGLAYHFVPNIFDVHKRNIETSDMEGIPVITLKNTPLDGWGRVYKRTSDILISAVCLILLSPIFLIVGILIKLDSKGKVIYANERVGRDGNFRFYKLRTMFTHLSTGQGYGGKEAFELENQLREKYNERGGGGGELTKIKDDPRVTNLGKVLRTSKLDEIPQFWNVLKGDMSMVGPRPHLPHEVDRYRARYPRMFTIKPGIFGLTQIAQMAMPSLPFEEEIQLDTYYIENWSIRMDIMILLKSFYYLFISPKKARDNY